MKFFETSKYFSLKKSTYITLRWIGFFGQLLAIYTVHRLLEFEFNFLLANLAILVGILSNLFLIYIYKKTQLSERSAFIFLIIDILQLTFLLYLTGGVANPFIIFLIIPSIFSSFNLGFRINVFIVVITLYNFFNFFYQDLPSL
jgi:two-component system sensor histidine kinase RegB